MRRGGDQVINRPTAVWVRPNNPFRNLDHSVLRSTAMLIQRIQEFSVSVQDVPPGIDRRPSAVLVPIFDGPYGPEVVLTRRSQFLSNHKGEISFPGGRIDEGESAIETAMREAFEEIDLHPKDVQIVGLLTALNTYVSKSHIVPVVAKLASRPSLLARNAEVDKVFTVPLIELVRDDTYSQEHWGEPPQQYQVHIFRLNDETIWGVTGRMLHQIINIALAK